MFRPTFVTGTIAWLDRRSWRVAAKIVDLGERAAALARRRVIELIIITVAMAIRFSMIKTYDPAAGYDAYDHLVYIQWFAHHWTIPGPMLSRVSYHPPLYYVIEGAFSRLIDAKVTLFASTSMLFSSATLFLIWMGLERYLPGRRLGRIAGLALAAILPAAVQVSGMASAEGLNGLLATTALLLAAEGLRRQQRGEGIVVRAALIGLLVGLEMLTKISAIATLATIGAAIGFEVLVRGGRIGDRVRRGAPWLLVIAVFAGTAGWYLVRNHRLYGKAVLDGFDGPDGVGAAKLEVPYLKRRNLTYFFGWSNDALTNPYYPSGEFPKAYFWPVVVTSTFVDHYNYGFVKAVDTPEAFIANGRGIPPENLIFARASAYGGVVIAASTFIAWLWVLIVAVRRRATDLLVLLMAPAATLAGLIHFVVKYPYDFDGAIKGVYLQFAMAPLFALFGLAVWKMTRRPATWPIAILQGVAFLAVTSYTIYARAFAI